jgi:hypothetical protein
MSRVAAGQHAPWGFAISQRLTGCEIERTYVIRPHGSGGLILF